MDVQRVYEVSMSTVVKVGDERTDFVVNKGKRKETFVSETAVISELYHPDDIAIARLAEEFGPTPAKFIDFQRDNSGNSIKFSAILVFIALIFVL